LLTCAVLAGPGLAGCALVTMPQTEASWTDARMAEDAQRQAPVFVPEIRRPEFESWRMASAAHQLADTRDSVLSQAQLLLLPPVDSLAFGQRAREQATPPPATARNN
jgi:hypothetical protein